MPVDPAALRRIVDHNERITEAVRAMSGQLEKLDPCKFAITSAAATAWAQNVTEVQVSLEGQQELSSAMRESARIQEEQTGDAFRDRYRFVVDRLKGDIRAFFHAMKDVVDLPQDFQRQKTWNDCIYDMEVDMKSLGAMSVGEHGLASVDPIVALLNFRDRVIDVTLSGILFRKAVLDWDLKSERAFADGPMVEMAERVVNIYSKTESLPAKLRLTEAPRAMEAGPFTFNSKQKSQTRPPLTALQCRLITVLHEMQSLDQGLRHMKFAEKVHISDRNKSSGKDSAAEELRKEFVKWSEHNEKLTQQLNNSRKTKGAAGVELQVEQLLTKLSEKDQTIKTQITRVHKLEGDWQSLKYELINLRREKAELQDKNNRMAKENMPHLEKMKHLLSKSQEAVDRLQADTAVLSETFWKQVQENKKIDQERDKISTEVTVLHKQLKSERGKKKAKEDDLEKKETLYLRTMAARKSIHESCQEQQGHIKGIEERMQQRDREMEEMHQVMEGQDAEMAQLQEELRRARRRIEELEQQKSACLKHYEAMTGQPGSRLLDNFKAAITLPL